jgi:hypothetical protein
LDADNGTSLAAGTVLWEGAEGTLSVGADDTYKPQSVKATVGTDALAGGLQGSNNPKDADGGTCASTLQAPVSGAYFVFNAKQDGYLYVIHKASSNKAYTVFEEGTAIGYTFAAVADATTELGAVYQFTLEGEGEFNALTAPVEWAEREYLKAEKPDVYAAHLSVDVDGKETWTAISKGGIGVIVFPVYADCQYIFNANGSKMTLGGIAFSEADNLTIKTTGNREIAVLVEGSEAETFAQAVKGLINIPYEVTSNAYVFIYGVATDEEETPAAAPSKFRARAKRTEAAENSVSIYDVQWVVNSATGAENVRSDQKPSTKVLRNGQLLILRGGKVYTITGQRIK